MTIQTDASGPATDDVEDTAMSRFRLLRPVIEDAVSVPALARTSGVSVPTLRRWLRRYREHGVSGLRRRSRSDRGGRHRVSKEMAAVIEGLALERPRRSVAAIHRIVRDSTAWNGAPVPSYATVHAIVRAMDPALMVLAHEGPKADAHAYDLLHRREASRPNEIWQADHTELDILVLDEAGCVVRPWLTIVIDDRSRAIAAYRISTGAPSALQTALALRNAIWRKSEAGWTICGIPEVLYTDHGSDFTSHHIEQVCAELKTRLIFSTVAQPRGRGRIERFVGTLNTCCLADLPGYIAPEGLSAKAGLTLAELDAALRHFILQTYHHTPHSVTGEAPQARRSRGGFLPQMPMSLEQLDLLLLTVIPPRQVHRDGIRFQSLRYIDPTLAAFVGEAVTILTTKEYRRFEEFCSACRRERYIGICYGPPGVGKTISARHYAKWHLLEGRDPLAVAEPVPVEVADCRCLLYTPPVTNTPRSVRSSLDDGRLLLRGLVGRARGPAYPVGQRDFSGRCELLIVDEADRLSTASIEELRDFYDRSKIGLVLVGMPGLEKRLARYAQFYSRVGFAHAFRPLSRDETRFVLEQHWQQWGGTIRGDEFADQGAVAAIITVTGGNFRLIDRLMAQVRRIKEINKLNTVTREVVDAARDCLVIGTS